MQQLALFRRIFGVPAAACLSALASGLVLASLSAMASGLVLASLSAMASAMQLGMVSDMVSGMVSDMASEMVSGSASAPRHNNNNGNYDCRYIRTHAGKNQGN
jgi:hypothetical protein